MSEWKEYKLRDFMEFNPKISLKKNTVARKIAMDQLVPHTRDIFSWTFEPYSGGSKFQNGDTIMARITPCLENGKHAFISLLDENEIAFGSTEFIVMRGRKDISDNTFVYYLSKFPSFKETAIKSMVGSSGRQRAQVDVLENLTMLLPPLPEQTIIASILSSLDDKIAVNRRICENLEAQAQALFKNWFVDFAPFKDGKFVESELGMIPEGWRVYSLSEFFPVVTGKKDANVAKGGIYPFFSCSQDFSWTDNYSFDGCAIIVAGNGDFNVKMYSGKFEAYQRTYVLIPYNPINTAWLYYAVKYHLAKITSAARGSVIKFITKGDLANFCVPVPKDIESSGIIEKFDCLRQTIALKELETRRLATLRDTLLPKLMSGEIKI